MYDSYMLRPKAYRHASYRGYVAVLVICLLLALLLGM